MSIENKPVTENSLWFCVLILNFNFHNYLFICFIGSYSTSNLLRVVNTFL